MIICVILSGTMILTTTLMTTPRLVIMEEPHPILVPLAIQQTPPVQWVHLRLRPQGQVILPMLSHLPRLAVIQVLKL